MKYTENYSLRKPDATDFYDVEDNNANMDEIDSALKEIKDSSMNKENPSGTGSLSMNRKENTPVGEKSTTEGVDCVATGRYAHSEGAETEALAVASHSEGYGTVAGSRYQHVEGMFNEQDRIAKYVHIIGGGYVNPETGEIVRLNIHTVDWGGNAEYRGGLTLGNDATVKSSKKDAKFYAENEDGYRIGFGIGSGGVHRGIYDNTSMEDIEPGWLIRRDPEGKILLGEKNKNLPVVIETSLDMPRESVNDSINKLLIGNSTPHDEDYYICQFAGGGEENSNYYRRPTSALWEYINNKANANRGCITRDLYITQTTKAGIDAIYESLFLYKAYPVYISSDSGNFLFGTNNTFVGVVEKQGGSLHFLVGSPSTTYAILRATYTVSTGAMNIDKPTCTRSSRTIK